MKKKIKWIILGCVAGLILFSVIVSSMFKGTAAVPVYTTQPDYGDVKAVIDISGIVESEVTATYYAPASGIISGVSVEEGDAVKAGELLIAYSDEDLEKQLTQAKLQAKSSESGYNATKNSDREAVAEYNQAVQALTDLEQKITEERNNLNTLNQQLTDKQNKYNNDAAKTTYDLTVKQNTLNDELQQLAASAGTDTDEYKAKELELKQLMQTVEAYNYSKQLVVTDEETKTLQNKIDAANQNLERLQTEKSKMESQKASSETAIMDKELKNQNAANYELSVMGYEETKQGIEAARAGITAEFDGVVSEVTAADGAPVSTGMQLVTVNSNEDVKVEVSLTKYSLERVEIGQKAEITVLNRTYQGTVSKISRMAVTGANGVAGVAAQIHIDNPDDELFLGIEAKVKILTDSAKGVLRIPVAAVNADKDGDFVYVVENGVIQKKYITAGISSDEYIEVKEGLTGEDSIVTNVYSNIEEGMQVMAIPME